MRRRDAGALAGSIKNLVHQNAAQHALTARNGAPEELHQLIDSVTREQIRELLHTHGITPAFVHRTHLVRALPAIVGRSESEVLDQLGEFGLCIEV